MDESVLCGYHPLMEKSHPWMTSKDEDDRWWTWTDPQSCFNGKFGEELGSDEFGAVTLYAVKNRDMFEAQIHISYTEFYWVGQAFRVGRYPIHFHLMGNVTGSYSR